MRNPGVGTQQSLKNEHMRMERGMNEKGFIGRRPEVTVGEMRRQFRRCSGGKAAHVETQFRQGVEDEMTLESGEVRHQYLLKAAYDL